MKSKTDSVFKFCIIILIAGICASCKHKEETGYSPVETWNGQEFNLLRSEYPVSIVWYKETAEDLWSPYKGFCQAKEISVIMQQAQNPEVNEPLPNLRTHNKMALFYYYGGNSISRIVTVYFDVNDGVFTGPRGKSRELGRLLIEKEESRMSRYTRPGMFLHDEKTLDAIEKSEKQMQEQNKLYEAQRPKDANMR